jgi:hypothetical protein
MNLIRFPIVAFTLIFLIGACASSVGDDDPVTMQSPSVNAEQRAVEGIEQIADELTKSDKTAHEEVEAFSSGQAEMFWPDGEVRLDEQGSVEVAVTPLNLNGDSSTLDFDVALNTHSVDLSMDLTSLATLKSDIGLGVTAVTWAGPSGGHHVSGMLSFPANVDGIAILDGASSLTMTIRNIDASERSFTWDYPG